MAENIKFPKIEILPAPQKKEIIKNVMTTNLDSLPSLVELKDQWNFLSKRFTE